MTITVKGTSDWTRYRQTFTTGEDREGRQQDAAAARSERDAYNRAYKACMEGRGYSVN